MTDVLYDPIFSLKTDLMGPVGAYEFHLLSGPPQETPKYLTIIKPFDRYVWAFTLSSLGVVTILLIIIDKIHATWSGVSSKDAVVTGQSNKN